MEQCGNCYSLIHFCTCQPQPSHTTCQSILRAGRSLPHPENYGELLDHSCSKGVCSRRDSGTTSKDDPSSCSSNFNFGIHLLHFSLFLYVWVIRFFCEPKNTNRGTTPGLHKCDTNQSQASSEGAFLFCLQMFGKFSFRNSLQLFVYN